MNISLTSYNIKLQSGRKRVEDWGTFEMKYTTVTTLIVVPLESATQSFSRTAARGSTILSL